MVAASAVFWGLRLWPAAPSPAEGAVPVAAATPPRGDLARVLGTDPPPPAAAQEPAPAVADSRFELVGVLSPRQAQAAREGVALIAVDGAPARAYRVGAPVTGETVLQAVAHNRATLGPRGGPAQVALELAPPAPAATGTLPGATPGIGAGAGAQPGFPRPMPPQAGPTAGVLAPMRPLPPRGLGPPPAMVVPQQPFPPGTNIVTTDTGQIEQERVDANNRPLQ